MNATKRFYRFVTVLVITGWGWIGINTFTKGMHYDVCLFKKVLKVPCPACGITHSIQAILGCRFEDAFSLNSLGYFALVGLVTLPIWLIYDSIKKRNSLFECYSILDKKITKQPIWLILTLVLIGINWLWILCRSL